MTTLQILVYRGKHGDSYWLADTSIRRAQAREALFRQLDEMGFYDIEDDIASGICKLRKGLKEARAGGARAIEIILESRRGYEYEDWSYEDVEVPCNGGAPGFAELLDFNTYQKAAHSLAIYPDGGGALYAAAGLTGEVGETVSKIGVMLEQTLVALTALRLSGSAGRVANQVKKIGRDDGGIPTKQRRTAIFKELGDTLWYVAEIATKMGFNLSDVAYVNMVNLFGRKDRGTLKGDGDNR